MKVGNHTVEDFRVLKLRRARTRDISVVIDGILLEGTLTYIYSQYLQICIYKLKIEDKLFSKHPDYKMLRKAILNLYRKDREFYLILNQAAIDAIDR